MRIFKAILNFIGVSFLITVGIVIGAYFIPKEEVFKAINGVIQWITQLF